MRQESDPAWYGCSSGIRKYHFAGSGFLGNNPERFNPDVWVYRMVI